MNKASRQIISTLFLVFVCLLSLSGQNLPYSASDWIDKIIENKTRNNIDTVSYHQFNQYEKFTLSLMELKPQFQNEAAYEKLRPLYQYVDTNEINHRKELTVSLKETLSQEFRQSKPRNYNSYISAIRHDGLDEILTSEKIDALIFEGLKQVNIFDNEINLFYKRFVSPLSSISAHSFYTYALKDSLVQADDKVMEITFTPKNKYDVCFYGSLYITTDGSFAVKKVVLHIPEDINLNYITELTITQDFEMIPEGKWVKSYEKSDIDFTILSVRYGMHIADERFYSDYQIKNESPIAFGFNDEIVYLPNANIQSDSAWSHLRPVPLKRAETDVKDAASILKKIPRYKLTLFIGASILDNSLYLSPKSKFDIGPLFSIISSNEANGTRFRLGGKTTSNLNENLYFNGYLAYGTRDKRMMYSAGVDYYFKHRYFQGSEFPVNNISFQYSYDVSVPGQKFYYANPDNFFLSFKRGKADKLTYIREGQLWYEKEFPNGFYYKVKGRMWNEEAASALTFVKSDAEGKMMNVGKFNQTEVGVTLRYARNEVYHQSRHNKFILRRDGPVFTLSHTLGLKGILNSDYNYQFTEFAAQKRLWLSGYGHLNMILKAGKLWGEVPYPLLILPNANDSYTIQAESYSLMNVLEFINDQYVSLDLSYNMDGWLFNRIDFIRPLKLREVFTFKGMVGSLSERNNPYYNKDLFLFPEDSHTMGKQPYIEVSIGIENIFKVLRVDYVRRLSYLHNEDISQGGLRLTYNLMF